MYNRHRLHTHFFGTGNVIRCMTLLLLLAVLYCNRCSAHETTTRELRTLYYSAYQNKSAAEQLLKITKDYSANDPLMLGYSAAAGFMMCNHVWSPYAKVKYFYSAKSNLEDAIKALPESTELRYLRFAIQTKAPAFLNYTQHINTDRDLLVAYLLKNENKSADKDLYDRISAFMQTSDKVPLKTKQQLGLSAR